MVNVNNLVSDPIVKIDIPGADVFIAAEKFKEGETIDGVKVALIGSNFKKNFFGKVERDVAPRTVRFFRLAKDASDAEILAYLGDKAEKQLAHLWELLKKHSLSGGILLDSGGSNIFYVRDIHGELQTILVRWLAHRHRANGWYIESEQLK